MIWQILLTFGGMVVLDFVWARYTVTVTQRLPIKSGSYAALIMVLNGTVTLTYVHDPWMILAAAAGAFVGTYLAGKWK
jgi:hypothetical protein